MTKSRYRHSLSRSVLGTLFVLCQVPLSYASDRNGDIERQSSFVFENDMFTFDDGGYTNGFGYLWGYGPFDSFDDRTPAWMERLTRNLYIATLPDKQRRLTYGVTQEIYTPEEIVDKDPDPNDRPYAGLLLWQANWFAYDKRVSDRLGLELGIVGSASGGEQTQKLVHEATTANKPQGWNEQLDNEPFFRIGLQRSWRLRNGNIKQMEYDFIGIAHVGAGTRRSELGAGLSIRIGNGLDHSFANASLNPARNLNLISGRPGNWYAFVGFGGEYVANDITLDGNTFKNSPSVKIENWQASSTVGAAWNVGRWGWLFSLRGITDEFDTQEKKSVYGSLSVSYHTGGSK